MQPPRRSFRAVSDLARCAKGLEEAERRSRPPLPPPQDGCLAVESGQWTRAGMSWPQSILSVVARWAGHARHRCAGRCKSELASPQPFISQRREDAPHDGARLFAMATRTPDFAPASIPCEVLPADGNVGTRLIIPPGLLRISLHRRSAPAQARALAAMSRRK